MLELKYNDISLIYGSRICSCFSDPFLAGLDDLHDAPVGRLRVHMEQWGRLYDAGATIINERMHDANIDQCKMLCCLGNRPSTFWAWGRGDNHRFGNCRDVR